MKATAVLRSPLRALLIGLLTAYRFAISPLYGQVCRYHPTCSAYALEAVTEHGGIRGSWLAARRVARCHPWAAGGYDPVPAKKFAGTAKTVKAAPDSNTSDQQQLGAANLTQGV